jgi:hypothetical protein
MKRFVAVLAALVVSVVIVVVPTVASAGPPTPIGIAEAKRAAKKYVHSYCRTHNCRGSRIKNCESKTAFRVDCEGLYGKGAKDVCEFKITVQAVKNRQIRFNIYGVKCHNL